MALRRQIRRTGRSLAITIPKDLIGMSLQLKFTLS